MRVSSPSLLRSGGEYSSFAELERHETAGIDFRISTAGGCSGVAVMAPHGGDIEPGTTEVARAIAFPCHSFYSLEGIKAEGNWALHIASTQFDEPLAVAMAGRAETVVCVHGCRDGSECVVLGGLDMGLKAVLSTRLATSGFAVSSREGLEGRRTTNLCNRSLSGMGVQIELSRRLRLRMFEGLSSEGRNHPSEVFGGFVRVIRGGIEEWLRDGSRGEPAHSRCPRQLTVQSSSRNRPC